MDSWTSEITNDPDNDYKLYIELLKNDHSIANLKMINGELVLKIFFNEESIEIPAEWISEIISNAKKDLK
jgi:hypothetical protein